MGQLRRVTPEGHSFRSASTTPWAQPGGSPVAQMAAPAALFLLSVVNLEQSQPPLSAESRRGIAAQPYLSGVWGRV